jgi:hypothetical protein
MQAWPDIVYRGRYRLYEYTVPPAAAANLACTAADKVAPSSGPAAAVVVLSLDFASLLSELVLLFSDAFALAPDPSISSATFTTAATAAASAPSVTETY